MPYENTVPVITQGQHASEACLATPEGRKGFWRAIFSCWLGTTMEYADFALYGLAAGIIFADIFFPAVTPAVALLASFATYSVGFIARPIGAFIFGWLGDRKGRKLVMMMTVTLMGISTTLIGLIPSYAHIGIWAPICLVILRFMQGLGAGAALSGGTVILGEFAPPAKRGLVSSIVALGSNGGTLLASLVWLLVLTMDKENLLDWGWRIPFLCSFLIAIMALFIRRYMGETPVFERHKAMLAEQRSEQLLDKREIDKREQSQATDKHRCFWQRTRAFWIMVGLRIGENGPSYLAQGFIIGYVANVLQMDKFIPTISVLIASVLGFLIIPLAGYFSDRFGRRITYRWFCLLLVCYAFPAFMLLESREPIVVILTIVVGMGLGSLGIFGVQAAWGVELFGVANRYSKMSVAKELGAVLSGGTAPVIAAALFSFYGHWWPIACYFAVMAGIGFVTTFFAPETRGRDLNLLEDAM